MLLPIVKGGVCVNNDELMHYGVLGMKWGVRRNARILAAHNRNSAIKAIQRQRKTGEISKSESRLAVKKAKKNFKTERRQLVKSVNSKDSAKSLKSKTISEVKHSTLKKGMHTINHILTAASVITEGSSMAIAVGTSAALGPAGAAFGTLALTANAVAAAGSIGTKYLVDHAIDSFS